MPRIAGRRSRSGRASMLLEPLFENSQEDTSSQNAKARRRGYTRSIAWFDGSEGLQRERAAQSVRGDVQTRDGWVGAQCKS